MFAGYQNNKIVLVKDTREELENAPCMVFDKIEELSEDYELYNGEYITVAQAEIEESKAEKEAYIAELQHQLDMLDLKTIRALRAIQSGNGTSADTAKLEELETQAEQVRQLIRDAELSSESL